jgi:Ca-activated chloride channel homolog
VPHAGDTLYYGHGQQNYQRLITSYFTNITFAQPWWFLLLLLVPAWWYWQYRWGKNRTSTLPVTQLSARGLQSWKSSLRPLPQYLRILAMIAIIVALARPHTAFSEQQAEGEGIDIILAIDVSGSMTAQDLRPNRLEAAKNVAAEFTAKRVTDRIGVVIFSGESFTQCPLTTDQQVVIQSIKNIRNGLLEDGTAIGSGLATSVDRLRNSSSKTKIVVLLTDGENNGGLIDPKTAKEIAKAFGVKVYTIGVGTDGYALTPVQTPMGDVVMQNEKVTIDEKLLTEIATETGGKYFRARDDEGLKNIYADIDTLEKTKVKITRFERKEDKFLPFIAAAFLLLFIELLLRFVVFRQFP